MRHTCRVTRRLTHRPASPDKPAPHTPLVVIVDTSMTNDILDSVPYDSPIGELTLVGSERGLRAILWPRDSPERAGLRDLSLRPRTSGILSAAADQLDEYFCGARTVFDVPLDLKGTAFQVAAWRELVAIPYGETRTYAEQAAVLDRPRAFRAVGAANGRNPISIVVPCHRVVGSDGGLHGFAGGVETKQWLLEHESANARPRVPSSKRASPEESASPARAGRNRGT